jgi:ribosomal peptide maturation radical SAM protein 1
MTSQGGRNTDHMKQEMTVVREGILDVLDGGGDILFVVPPFATINIAQLGPLALLSLAKAMGYRTEILYLNILLASVIGKETYEGICDMPYNMRWMKLGERLFARSAHGLPPLGRFSEYSADEAICISGPGRRHARVTYDSGDFDLSGHLEIEKTCDSFIHETVRTISSLDFRIIGCTTMVEQTNCGVALLNRIKRIRPEVVTLIGGINCEGVMAEGVASLSTQIDYVFSGESELALTEFLRRYSEGDLPSQRVIAADPPKDLDALPLPDYQSFFDQMERFLGENGPKQTIICYETSRGCWWGQTRRCSFCGNNTNESIVFRQKSVEKASLELATISENYKPFGVLMTDNIVPRSYYTKLFPKMSETKGLPLWYQENADLKLGDLLLLKKARVNSVVFGIESLSTGLLKLLHKKTTASRNLLLLRNALSVGIHIRWHMLWGFPGDKIAYYEELLELIPLITHLQPPAEILHLVLVRFSPYMENPRAHGITNIRPVEIYKQIYPEWADIDKLAYEFIGDFPCEAHENPGIMREIVDGITHWKSSWKKAFLVMKPFADEYAIIDGRIVGAKAKNHVLDYAGAREVMRYGRFEGSEYQKWAVEEKLGTVVDSLYIPLVTASPDLLAQFEERAEK